MPGLAACVALPVIIPVSLVSTCLVTIPGDMAWLATRVTLAVIIPVAPTIVSAGLITIAGDVAYLATRVALPVILPVALDLVLASLGTLARDVAGLAAVVALAVILPLLRAITGDVAWVATAVAGLIVSFGTVLLHMPSIAAVVACP